MNDVERYDRILDFMLDELGSGYGANNNLIRTKLFPELKDYQIQDIIQQMHVLQPTIFYSKPAGSGYILVVRPQQRARAKAF